MLRVMQPVEPGGLGEYWGGLGGRPSPTTLESFLDYYCVAVPLRLLGFVG